MSNYSINLSTTEPNNYVGLIKMRQGDSESQTLNVMVTADGLPFIFDRLSVYFNAVMPDGTIARDKVPKVDYVHSSFDYTLNELFLQNIGRITAWFSFENDERIIDSTKNFNYTVVGGWKEAIPQGNYIYELSEIQREIEEIISNKNFTSLIQRMIRSETMVDFLDNDKISKDDLSEAMKNTDEKIEQLVNGSPKGVFDNIEALKAAFPSGDSGIYVVKDTGKWCYWNGKDWVYGGTYQASLLTTESVKADNIDSNVFKDDYVYSPNWKSGYVASVTNASYPEGTITDQEGVSIYKHTEFIPVHKNDAVFVECRSLQGVVGLAKFDKNQNYVRAIMSEKNFFTDLIYLPEDDLEFLVLSNTFANYTTPKIRIIKNYQNIFQRKPMDITANGYDGSVSPNDLVFHASTTYKTSKAVLVRPGENLSLSLLGSSNTSLLMTCAEDGSPTSNLVTGLNLKGQWANVVAEDKPIVIRFVNKAAEFTAFTQLITTSHLKNLTFGMIGDSYVKGNKTDSSLTAYHVASVWNALKYTNYGLNGNTIATYEGITTPPISERFKDMVDELDIIGFEGGRNDYNHNIPIGEDSDKDNTTFKGALNVLCEGLIKKYLGKVLFGVPCWPVNTTTNSVGATQNDYLAAFVHVVSDLWGIPVLDTRSSGIYMNSKDFLNEFTEDGNSISHLNAEGHVLFAGKVSKFMQGL